MEAKRWHWDSPDTNYVRYILLVIILDLSIGLFVSFAAVCPTWVHISVDSTMLLNVALSNDRWTENWTYGGKWDKCFNIWIKYEHYYHVIIIFYVCGLCTSSLHFTSQYPSVLGESIWAYVDDVSLRTCTTCIKKGIYSRISYPLFPLWCLQQQPAEQRGKYQYKRKVLQGMYDGG